MVYGAESCYGRDDSAGRFRIAALVYKSQSTKLPKLKFRTLLTDGARELRFE